VTEAELSYLDLDVGPVAHGGHCLARTAAGQVVFVRHALPGERVRAIVTEERRGYLRADAVEVLAAAPGRVEPPCPWARPGMCGGCDFQHASLDLQRELKAAVVREQLTRIGGLSEAEVAALRVQVVGLPDVPGEPPGFGWRTRVRYTVDTDGRAGLLKHRSHEVVPIDWCRIAHPAVRSATVDGEGVLERSWPDHAAVEVIASGTGAPASGGQRIEVTVLGVLARDPFTASGVKRGPLHVEEHALGRTWRLPAQAFWQVHPAAAQTLANCVVELLDPRPGERVWDLYGGVGLFAAALAPHVASGGESPGRVTVVESDPDAAGAAESCLADLPDVAAVRARVERALTARLTGGRPPGGRPSGGRRGRARSGPGPAGLEAAVDLVVLDPPRAGAGRAVVEQIVLRRPRAVAYVACDPAALARDVRSFREAGWRLAVLRGFDLFPQTHHVECVALLMPAQS